jgi:hypothetical protein
MKHACIVKGCGRKGVWLAPWHPCVYSGRHIGAAPTPPQRRGRVEEGRKVGKPRAWRAARRAKDEVRVEMAVAASAAYPALPPALEERSRFRN